MGILQWWAYFANILVKKGFLNSASHQKQLNWTHEACLDVNCAFPHGAVLAAVNEELTEDSALSSESEMTVAINRWPLIVVEWVKRDRKSKNSNSNSRDDTIISNPATLCGLTVIIKPNDPSKVLTIINPRVSKNILGSSHLMASSKFDSILDWNSWLWTSVTPNQQRLS